MASLAAAVRAWLGKHHVAARRLHDARAVAMRTTRFGDGKAARTVARAAMHETRDADAARTAGKRLVECHVDCLVQVGAALVLTFSRALLEDVREQVAERRGRGALDAHREIETLEAERVRVALRRRRPLHVVAAAPVRI